MSRERGAVWVEVARDHLHRLRAGERPERGTLALALETSLRMVVRYGYPELPRPLWGKEPSRDEVERIKMGNDSRK